MPVGKTAPVCVISGCFKEAICAELCSMHYRRKKRHGDPLAGRRPNGSGAIGHGYVILRVNGKLKREHIIIAEKALGRALPEKAEVHHVNNNRSDNRPENLVICPDHEYHRLLHLRTAALDACGHADWRKCTFCGVFADPAELRVRKKTANKTFVHAACERNSNRMYRHLNAQNPPVIR